MRIVNRLLALLVSLTLMAVGVVTIIDVIAERIAGRPVVFDWHATYRWAQRSSWNSRMVLAISAALAAVGLLLLIAALIPRRIRRLRVRGDDPETDSAITRRGLARTVQTAVADLDSVRDLKVKVGRRRVKVRAQTRPIPAAADARHDIQDAAGQRLAALRLRRTPRLSVRLSRGGS